MKVYNLCPVNYRPVGGRHSEGINGMEASHDQGDLQFPGQKGQLALAQGKGQVLQLLGRKDDDGLRWH
jgi:hypothetical protein